MSLTLFMRDFMIQISVWLVFGVKLIILYLLLATYLNQMNTFNYQWQNVVHVLLAKTKHIFTDTHKPETDRESMCV